MSVRPEGAASTALRRRLVPDAPASVRQGGVGWTVLRRCPMPDVPAHLTSLDGMLRLSSRSRARSMKRSRAEHRSWRGCRVAMTRSDGDLMACAARALASRGFVSKLFCATELALMNGGRRSCQVVAPRDGAVVRSTGGGVDGSALLRRPMLDVLRGGPS